MEGIRNKDRKEKELQLMKKEEFKKMIEKREK